MGISSKNNLSLSMGWLEFRAVFAPFNLEKFIHHLMSGKPLLMVLQYLHGATMV